MSNYAKKKKKYQQQEIVLVNNRFVAKWGYEHNVDTVLLEILRECADKDVAELFKSYSNLLTAHGDRPFSNEKLLAFVFEKHPAFQKFSDSWRSLGGASKSHPSLNMEDTDADWFPEITRELLSLRRRVILEYAKLRLRKYVKGGNRRILVFKDFDADMLESRWVVTDSKVVCTGSYVSGDSCYSAYAYEDDYSPPYLTDVKQHFLLQCYHFNPSMDSVWLLEADTLLWSDFDKRSKVAKRLSDSA